MAYEAEKRYEDDWAKAKSRELVRDVIQRTLLTFRKPKDLKVLCFPGIDATEVFQVYDALGIPRQNITGLERDSYVADQLEKKNLGIRVVRKSVEDFVKEAHVIPFEIISLDYTGPINQQAVNTLSVIGEKQERNTWILHQANLVKRDSQSTSWYVGGFAGRCAKFEAVRNTLTGKEEGMITDVSKSRDEATEGIESGNSRDYKSKGYSGVVVGALEKNFPQVALKLLRFVTTDEQYSAIERTLLKGVGEKEKTLEELSFNLRGDQMFGVLLEDSAYRLFANRMRITGLTNPEILYIITRGLQHAFKEGKYFTPLLKEGYSYVSESGAPMIGDIYSLIYPKKIVEAGEKMGECIGFPNRLVINPKGLEKLAIRIKRFVEISHELRRATINELSGDPEENLLNLIDKRTFLGSSAKPVLTKAKAIEEMRAGLTDDEIARKYRGVNGKPLPQWRAHVTMGTYDSQPRISEESIQESPEDSNIEKISKEQVIDLLASGIPVDEIASAYPTSFSKGQLRAFKAHITMGTYPTDK